MNNQKLALDCDGCRNFHECKTKLKACELYHNALEFLSLKGAKTRPSYAYFDASEEAYFSAATTFITVSKEQQWDLACQIYDSSIGETLDPEFKSIMREWKWAWAYKLNKLVGGLGYEVGREYTINFLYVREAHQGYGIGSSLIRHVIPDGEAVIVMPDHDSGGFYDKIGYEQLGPVYTNNLL